MGVPEGRERAASMGGGMSFSCREPEDGRLAKLPRRASRLWREKRKTECEALGVRQGTVHELKARRGTSLQDGEGRVERLRAGGEGGRGGRDGGGDEGENRGELDKHDVDEGEV
jgi:hypothetical protein